MSKLDHAASLISSDAASTQKATLQHRTTNRKSINTGYETLYLRRKVVRISTHPNSSGLKSTSFWGDFSGLIPFIFLLWFNVIQDQGASPEWPEWNPALFVRTHKIIHQRHPLKRRPERMNNYSAIILKRMGKTGW